MIMGAHTRHSASFTSAEGLIESDADVPSEAASIAREAMLWRGEL